MTKTICNGTDTILHLNWNYNQMQREMSLPRRAIMDYTFFDKEDFEVFSKVNEKLLDDKKIFINVKKSDSFFEKNNEEITDKEDKRVRKSIKKVLEPIENFELKTSVNSKARITTKVDGL